MHFEIAPGGNTAVIFGGKGRPIVGKLVGLDAYEGITLAIIPHRPMSSFGRGAPGLALVAASNIGPVFMRDGLPVSKDGTFQVNKVLPEYYQLVIRNADNSIYHVQRVQVSPPGRDLPDQPLDLKEIKLVRRQ